jgi:hypothetical protein
MFSAAIPASTLKPETIAAWNESVEEADAAHRARLVAGATFLWTYEDSDRLQRVKQGEIVIAPGQTENPLRVPGGLIHHWAGAMFLPQRTIDELLAITRDYDRYKDYYIPLVAHSKMITRTDALDRYSLTMTNKQFLATGAFDVEYTSTNTRPSAERQCSITGSTRLREVAHFGGPNERRIPEGEGSGYLWKLHSIYRIEQRDGGIYVETEMMVLSRDIPVALRFIVNPIVRRLSRNSLHRSLQQTAEAVLARTSGSRGAPARQN